MMAARCRMAAPGGARGGPRGGVERRAESRASAGVRQRVDARQAVGRQAAVARAALDDSCARAGRGGEKPEDEGRGAARKPAAQEPPPRELRVDE